MTENLERVSIEQFITEVLGWRDKYVENNPCVFKVEAFLQRDWENPCLKQPLCWKKHGQVENSSKN